MLSYNAPDIYPKSASSTTSSAKSDDDLSDSAPTNHSSPPTSPDVPSPPKQSTSPEPNHLSCYFTPPGQSTTVVTTDAPAIPQRAPSHTKKSYDRLPRQRSTSRLSGQSSRTVSSKGSFSFSRSSSSSTSTAATQQSTPPQPHHVTKMASSPALKSPAPPLNRVASQSSLQHKDYNHAQHPFGSELAQVSEIAEEFGIRERFNHIIDREEQDLVNKGLFKFCADEYVNEIQGLFSSIWLDTRPTATTAAASSWI